MASTVSITVFGTLLVSVAASVLSGTSEHPECLQYTGGDTWASEHRWKTGLKFYRTDVEHRDGNIVDFYYAPSKTDAFCMYPDEARGARFRTSARNSCKNRKLDGSGMKYTVNFKKCGANEL
eukprot:TRINITY_DN53661_c0_g1_i1.p1 TRINITY_DN53661_c0_g1~~TRINITY_DN53661_c0_g1_i1.p1  ORF type:complete len:143 (-),score=16.73 TRINITY_DN53661_c0_g1_i1:206-571(-)